MSAVLLKTLWVIGITVAVSLLVALMVRMLVAITARLERAAGSVLPEARVCPVDLGIPDEDVAAVFAAVYAVIGPHRVVHIGPGGYGRSWITEGRVAHHASHTPHAPRRAAPERHKEET
jgi:hypothetical protein